MPRYVALLRAINVGGRFVKMDRLRELFAGMGLRDVETFIASGNVLFDSRGKNAAALERRIEQGLADALGYEVDTFVRTPAELAAVAAFDPGFRGANDPAYDLWVGFLKAAPDEDAVRKVGALVAPTDEFRFEGRELYWGRRKRSTDQLRVIAKLDRIVGGSMTMRNVTTVRTLAEMTS